MEVCFLSSARLHKALDKKSLPNWVCNRKIGRHLWFVTGSLFLFRLLPKPEEDESGQEVALTVCSRMIELIRNVCLNDIIKTREDRMHSLLKRMQDVRHICLDYVLSEGRPPPESHSRTRNLVYVSAQKLMLYLGDLARYEEMIKEGQNFGKARK